MNQSMSNICTTLLLSGKFFLISERIPSSKLLKLKYVEKYNNKININKCYYHHVDFVHY